MTALGTVPWDKDDLLVLAWTGLFHQVTEATAEEPRQV